jgi:hypothetical protein
MGRRILIILLFLSLTAATVATGQDEYQEFYFFDQENQEEETGPTEFMVYGMQPAYLIINGQSQPYNPSNMQYNSFWIQGSSRWTQYMQCPLNAKFKLLAFTKGGPAQVLEVYPNGYQDAREYQLYPGYTQFVFRADAVGRHTLSFSWYDQKSNSIIIDVMPTNPNPQPGGLSDPLSPGTILIDSVDEGFDLNAGPILSDSQDQGFLSDVPQGEPI